MKNRWPTTAQLQYCLVTLKEWVTFSTALVLSMLLFGDEEPLVDFSDLNLAHAALFLVCALAVCWDNFSRARHGQLVHKDRMLLFSSMSF